MSSGYVTKLQLLLVLEKHTHTDLSKAKSGRDDTNPSNFLIFFSSAQAWILVSVIPLPFGGQNDSINMFKLVALLCLAASLEAATFDYNFARNKMFPLAAAAYSDAPFECALNVFDELISMEGLNEIEYVLNCYYRGTDSSSQLWQELVNKGYMNAWPFGKEIVSSYFFFAFMSLWNGHLDHHFEIMHKKYPDYEIWETGRSLGGAMASLAAHWIKNAHQIPGNKIKLVTFGQPRTGDDEYSKQFNADVGYYNIIFTSVALN
ncbi:unnamed protein product [Cylicocyclus nassatus]|uniref:Fungal lipase-type domain-containing protein n=1 Tax=Cylicocyclus nassatus TaxID=53992 RepID=A0AA36GRA6_CYLNA|nr:unnamed protein product [Cylicocyclus nassatus]